jgi:hypothetical protein
MNSEQNSELSNQEKKARAQMRTTAGMMVAVGISLMFTFIVLFFLRLLNLVDAQKFLARFDVCAIAIGIGSILICVGGYISDAYKEPRDPYEGMMD